MKILLNIYLFVLALNIGAQICAGAFVAPVIFRAALYIDETTLSTFESGLLMTQVFIKGNYLMLVAAGLALISEIALYPKTANFKLKFSTLMLSVIFASLAGLFAFYFTPYIIEASKLGVDGIDEKFAAVHSASELAMKIMLIAQALLFFLRFNTSLSFKGK